MKNVRTLLDLVEETFGIRTSFHENPLAEKVGATAVRFLNSNPNRLEFVFVNNSVQPIWIRPASSVCIDGGIYVGASGGKAVFKWDDDFSLTTSEWWAIGSQADQPIYTLEVYIIG